MSVLDHFPCTGYSYLINRVLRTEDKKREKRQDLETKPKNPTTYSVIDGVSTYILA